MFELIKKKNEQECYDEERAENSFKVRELKFEINGVEDEYLKVNNQLNDVIKRSKEVASESELLEYEFKKA